MEIQSHISSGILESFVLGLTTAEETQLVLELMEQYPEIRNEIIDIEQAIIMHAEEQGSTPSTSVKEDIMAEINVYGEKKTVIHPASINVMKSAYSTRLLIAASITLFLISAAFNFYLLSNWKKAEQKLVVLNTEKLQLAQEFNVQQSHYKLMENNLSVLQSPYSKSIMLKGMTLSPNSMAMVYWNSQSHVVFINTLELPKPPVGKQYQLWALADGKPIDAGVFEVLDSMQMQKMKVISSAEAFAVTLENAGGSPTPTLSAMYLMGSI